MVHGEPLLPPARGGHGTCRKAEDRAGLTLPSEFPRVRSLTALESEASCWDGQEGTLHSTCLLVPGTLVKY